MISVSFDEPGDLPEAGRRLPADRMLGWVGTSMPGRGLLDSLHAADIEPILGTLGQAIAWTTSTSPTAIRPSTPAWCTPASS